MTGPQLVKLLARQGFVVSRIQGSHQLLRHADGRRTAIPLHGNRDIALPLLMRILRQVELKPEEYAELVSHL